MKLNITYRVATSDTEGAKYFDEPQDAEQYFEELCKGLQKKYGYYITHKYDRWPILKRRARVFVDSRQEFICVTLQTTADGMLLK